MLTIQANRGQRRPVWAEGKGSDPAGMTDKCGPQTEGRHIPEFDEPVAPAGGDGSAVRAKAIASIWPRWPSRLAFCRPVDGSTRRAIMSLPMATVLPSGA
jgi:hypothetical protein